VLIDLVKSRLFEAMTTIDSSPRDMRPGTPTIAMEGPELVGKRVPGSPIESAEISVAVGLLLAEGRK
jgi:hypothetical protein